MLRVILAQAELELVPEAIAGHPQVRRLAQAAKRRPSELLLDQNQHHQALKGLPDGQHRGRPDIVHYTLLTLLESPLGKSGGLELAVHTRNDVLITVRPDTRLPRGEARFQGLLSKVLRTGVSNEEGPPLLQATKGKAPGDVVDDLAKGPVLRLDEHGARMHPRDLVAKARPDLTLVLGAFAHGDFSDAWKSAAPDPASLWPEPLAAWAVAADVVAAFRPDFHESPPSLK